MASFDPWTSHFCIYSFFNRLFFLRNCTFTEKLGRQYRVPVYLAPSFTNYYYYFLIFEDIVLYIFYHLLIWLYQVLVVACELSCGMWDPVPWAGMGHRPPAFESQSPPALDHQGNPSPWYSSSFMSLGEVTDFQFTQLFFCCQDRVATYKNLRNRTGNRKSHTHF